MFVSSLSLLHVSVHFVSFFFSLSFFYTPPPSPSSSLLPSPSPFLVLLPSSFSLSLSLSFLTFFFSSFLFFFFSLLLLLLHHHSGRTSARTLRTLCPTGGDRDAQRAVLPAGGGSQRIFKQTHKPTHRTIKDALRSSGRRDGRAPAAEGPPEHRTRTGDSPRHPELQPSFCFAPARRKHPLRC